MPIRLAQVGDLRYDSAHVKLPLDYVETQHLFPDKTACTCHLGRIRLPFRGVPNARPVVESVSP